MNTDEHLSEILRRLTRIEAQVTRTNGRVTRLEQAKAYTDGMRAGLGWVQPFLVAVVSGVIVALVAVLAGG